MHAGLLKVLLDSKSNLLSAAQNKHVSVPVALALVCEVGKIWLPNHRDQFDATQKLFLGYAVVSAANTGPPQPPPPPPASPDNPT